MSKKIALITGITGQDGSYLAEFLLAKNYRVVGLSRKQNSELPENPFIEKVVSDLNNFDSIYQAISQVQPNEVYNLASQSHCGEAWKTQLETMETNGLGAHRLFDAVRSIKPDCRIFHASSAEMFGEVKETPQNEQTPFNPLNPYAAAKMYAHNMAKIYRKSYQMFISCGILFNHESPRRGMHFITQKISYAAACLKLGIENSPLLNEKGDPIVKNGKLALGNLDAKRDWGYAKDYVEAMWLMLQQSSSDDFIIGTGQIKTIRQLCQTAFSYVGLDWEKHITVDQRLVRPVETGPTVANPTKAKQILGWQAKKTFEDLIGELVEYHLKQIKQVMSSNAATNLDTQVL